MPTNQPTTETWNYEEQRAVDRHACICIVIGACFIVGTIAGFVLYNLSRHW